MYPNTIVEAMDYISSVTKWAFVERSDERDYLHFFDGDRCSSSVG